MKCQLMLYFVVVFSVGAFALSTTEEEWIAYKQRFDKSYVTPSEDFCRLNIWKKNTKFVEKHNRLNDLGEKSYRVEMNQFADLTPEEFSKQFKTEPRQMKDNVQESRKGVKSFEDLEDPDSVDWTTKCLYPTYDQGQNGAGSIYASVEVLGCYYYLGHPEGLIEFSYSQLINCMRNANNDTSPVAIYEYIRGNGITNEYCWDEWLSCSLDPTCYPKTFLEFVNSYTGGDESVLRHLVVSGPLTVAIDASQPSFQLYQSGIYDEPACSSTQLDHVLVLEGYGQEQKTDFWLAKNSWGANWGVRGYIQMSRGKNNQCGIASGVVYPTV